MRKNFTILFLFMIAALFSQTLMAQTQYRSQSSGDWSLDAPNRWEIFNGSIWVDAVTPPTSADGVITILSGHNITVGNSAVTADELVVATGGTLTVNTALTLDDGTGIDLEVDGSLTLFSDLLPGTGTPTVQIDGLMDWTGGTVDVPTTITASAVMNISGNNKNLNSTLTNDGTVNWSASQISFNTGTFDNNSVFNATGNDPMNHVTGTNVFNNNATGTFNKNTGAGTTSFNLPITNAGIININSGTIATATVNSNLVNTGTINLSSTTLTIGGGTALTSVLDATTVIAGTGTVNLNQPTAINFAYSLPATIVTNIALPAGNNISGTGSITVNGTLNWSTGRVAIPITVDAAGTFNSTAGKDIAGDVTNDGIINLTDPATGSLDFESITFTNNGTINVNYTMNRFFSSGGAGNSLINNGVINKTTTTTLTINAGVPVTNAGTIQGSGIYLFSGGITNNGTLAPGTAGNPSTMRVNNPATGAGSTVEIEIINNSGAGVGNDVLEISTGGVTTLNGTLTIIDNPSAVQGVYTIMTNPGGTFALTPPFTTVNRPYWYADPVVSPDGETITIEKVSFPLPLVWGDFKATAESRKVQLNWTTLEEKNTSHFVVEHSVDGRTYNAIGTLSAQGNSSETVAYHFTHSNPNTSRLNQYRINQIDIDGRSSYSAVRTVKFNNGNVVPVTATPNPVRDVMQLSVQLNDVTVVLSDVSGNALRTYKVPVGNHQVNIGNLPNGVYHLSVYQNSVRIDAMQIIKQ